jgi:hypothetical protein
MLDHYVRIWDGNEPVLHAVSSPPAAPTR